MTTDATPADVLAGRARWCVVHGDCLDVLPTLPDASVDHVITDPPYEAEAHTLQRRIKVPGRDLGDSTHRRVSAMPLPFAPIGDAERAAASVAIAALCQRWCLVFCQCEATHRWAIALAPLRYVRTMVWIKPDGQPQLTGDRPGMGYESIVVCHGTAKRLRWNGGGRVGVLEHTREQSHRGVAGIRSWHPSQKPISLMVELVDLFTDPGELICDPFAGSGTTGVAAIRRGRRFIGIEQREDWAQLARDRIAAEEAGSDLRSVRAGQLPLLGKVNG